jgi:hypothetical protein
MRSAVRAERSSGEGRPYPVRANVGSGTPEPQPASDSLERDLALSVELTKPASGVTLPDLNEAATRVNWHEEREEARRRERAYEPGRFERAVNLVIGKHVRRLGPGEYEIDGNEQPVYHVAPDGDLPCDCMDSRMRPNIICKHRLAAVLCELDLPLVQAFSDVLERRKKHAKEAGIETEEDAA